MPLVVSYGDQGCDGESCQTRKEGGLYAKQLHELKKQLLHAKSIASKLVKQASPLEKKDTFSDQGFAKVTQGAKDSSVSQNASPPKKSPQKKLKKVKSMTPEEKAKKKEEARKKKEEAKRKKEEAKRKKEEARRKKEEHDRIFKAEKTVVDALVIEANACSKSPLLQEQQTDQKGSTDAFKL